VTERLLRLGPATSLDTAIDLTKRLQRDANALLLEIDNTVEGTTVQLSIPPSGIAVLRETRQTLWSAFIARNIERRHQLWTRTESALDVRRQAVLQTRTRIIAIRKALAAAGR